MKCWDLMCANESWTCIVYTTFEQSTKSNKMHDLYNDTENKRDRTEK